MLKWLSHKMQCGLSRLIGMGCLLLVSFSVWAADTTLVGVSYTDRTRLIAQQTELLKNRLTQAQNQLAALQHQDENQATDYSMLYPSKEVRSQAALNTAVAKSNVDSLNIELSESDQTINRLEKEIQEIENQLNVFSIFGL